MFKNKKLSLRPQIHIEAFRPNDAVFLGWQSNFEGGFFPLYIITAQNHPSNGSTVTDETLRKMKLEIPQTPLLKDR